MATSVVILNWNELAIVRDSVRRLLKEPAVKEVIVVDNGSTDGSEAYFNNLKGLEKLGYVRLPENQGSSVGRNVGLLMTTSETIFLLDGDILYVPGTIAEYQRVLDHYPDAACVGQHSLKTVTKYGHNGTTNIIEADTQMISDYTVSDWFPMAWTQYGLFRGDLLREIKFTETPPFNQPGHGYEDDWLYHEFKERGLVSLALDAPLYYHQAHTSLKELKKAGLNDQGSARQAAFQARWGKDTGWRETLIRITPDRQTTRHWPD